MLHFDKKSLLATEASVLAHDDEYAIIAFRIRRRWIVRNIRLLTALLDLAVAGLGKPKA